MNRQYIDDQHIVARYLADQLSDDERQAFEAYYLEHPDIVQELEAAARLKIGLAHLGDAGTMPKLTTPRPLSTRHRILAAAVAIAAVALALAAFMLPPPVPAPVLVSSSTVLHDKRDRPLPLAATHTLQRTRGAAYDAVLDVPTKPHVIALRVLPETQTQPARYRLVLSMFDDSDQAREIASITGLAPEADGFVPVLVNSSRVAAGLYQLTLSGDAGTSAADASSAFRLRVRPASTDSAKP
jgi:hypothetical protein